MNWIRRTGSRLKPRELEIFVTVVEHGNMARAAEILAVSRPVISKAVSNLEHQLQVRLLDRHVSGVEPTQFGRTLYRRALAILDEIRGGIEALETARDPSAGEMRFGATETLMASLVPCALKAVLLQFPGATVTTFIGSNDFLLRQLVDRRCELIIARNPTRVDKSLIHEDTLYHERLRVVVGKSHELARKARISLRDLMDSRWILSPAEIVPEGPANEAFAAEGLRIPKAVISSQSRSLRLSLLESGEYVTLMPESVLSLAPKYAFLKALPIEIPPWRTPTTISSLANRTLSPISYVLIDAIKDCVRAHISRSQSDAPLR